MFVPMILLMGSAGCCSDVCSDGCPDDSPDGYSDRYPKGFCWVLF